jgi:hypothetical protein
MSKKIDKNRRTLKILYILYRITIVEVIVSLLLLIMSIGTNMAVHRLKYFCLSLFSLALAVWCYKRVERWCWLRPSRNYFYDHRREK